jgi:hypothetical protein
MILQILDQIAATKSRNEKESILKSNAHNPLLKRVFRMAYDPFATYYIRQTVEYECKGDGQLSLAEGLDVLIRIQSREVTGNAAINLLRSTLESMASPDDAVVLWRVTLKDLRCGVSIATINKIWNKLVLDFENTYVMRADKDLSRIRYPAFSQLKSDGVRCVLMYDGKSARAFTRAGNELIIHGVLDESAALLMKKGEMWDGELVCYRDGKPLDRKTSNGIINKAEKGTIQLAEAELIRFVCWDYLDPTKTIKYSDRWAHLVKEFAEAARVCEFGKFKHKFILTDTIVVNNEQEAQDHAKKLIDEGHEGTVVKNLDGLWEPKRSVDQCKIKTIVDHEFRVTGIIPGTGKYEGMIGAINVQTDDDQVKFKVGSGLSDEQRATLGEEIVGQIVTVRHNGLISAKGRDTYKVFLPRIVEFRTDKDYTDDLARIAADSKVKL